jgi:hypothetical protein
MDSAKVRRRTVALIAAYAVALHALLLAFVPATPATLMGPLAALCAHDSTDGSGQGQPGHNDLPCAALCAAIGHGIAGPLPPAVAIAVVVLQDAAAPAIADGWVPLHRIHGGPQIPRGPPLA